VATVDDSVILYQLAQQFHHSIQSTLLPEEKKLGSLNHQDIKLPLQVQILVDHQQTCTELQTNTIFNSLQPVLTTCQTGTPEWHKEHQHCSDFE
jgi:hypothetical protein